MKLAADGGGGTGIKIPLPEVSSVEVFDEHKQKGLTELQKDIQAAVEEALAKGEGGSEEVLKQLFSMAETKANGIRENLGKIHAAMREDGDAIFRVSISEDLDQEIKGLAPSLEGSIGEALAEFDQKLETALRESLPAQGAKKDEVKEVVAEPTPVAKEPKLEGADALVQEVEEMQKTLAAIEKKNAEKKSLTLSEKLQLNLLPLKIKQKRAEMEALSLAAPSSPEPAPDPVPPIVDPAPTPDVVPPTPIEAGAGVSAFEQRVLEDKARFDRLDGLVQAWPKSEALKREDRAIKDLANWQHGLFEAESALIAAENQQVRGSKEEQIRRQRKMEPRGSNSLENLQVRLETLLSAATVAEEKEAIEARIVVLDMLAEGRAPRPQKTPDAAPTPPVKDPTPDPVPPVADPIPPSSPDVEGPMHGPETLDEALAREKAVIRKLEVLALKTLDPSLGVQDVAELDTPGPHQEHSDLTQLLLRANEVVDLLERASKETNERERQKLFTQREILLKDTKVQELADIYTKRMGLLLQGMEPTDSRRSPLVDHRLATMSALSEIFPGMKEHISVITEKKQKADTLDARERKDWETLLDGRKKKFEALQKALTESGKDEWYTQNKASVDLGVAVQEGFIKRVEALLAARTVEERATADQELVKFKQGYSAVPELVPKAEGFVKAIQEKVVQAEKELGEINTGEKDEEVAGDDDKKGEKKKKKEAIALKKKEIDGLKGSLTRLALVAEVQKDITNGTTSAITDAEVMERQRAAKEQNAFKTEDQRKSPESPEAIRRGMERHSGAQMAETRIMTGLAKETRAQFVEGKKQFTSSAHKETQEVFSPIYAMWEEEQQASFALLDTEREYNFLDHLEIGVTQGLRSLDRLGSGVLNDEAMEALRDSLPSVVRKLFTKNGDKTTFMDSLKPEERTAEGIKGLLYETLRKVTQDKIKTGQELEAALAAVEKTKKTEGAVQEARARLESDLALFEKRSKDFERELGERQPGGSAHEKIRWAQDGARLQYDAMVAKQNVARLQDQLKDVSDLEGILGTRRMAAEDPTKKDPNASLAFELRKEPSEQIVAIMQRQAERGLVSKAEDDGRTQFIQNNPGMLNTFVAINSSINRGVAKSSEGGGGAAPKSMWQEFQSSWAGKLMRPFTDLFSGWFGDK